MASKKNTIVVSGYYSVRKMRTKAGQTAQPMEEEQPDTQNQSGGNYESEHDSNSSERYRQGVVAHSMGNGQKGINLTDHVGPVSSLPLNSNLNGLPSCLNGIDSVLKETIKEPSKSKRSRMSPDTAELSKSRASLSGTNPSQPSEAPLPHMPSQPSAAPLPHVPDKVSQNNFQGRVLPSWTCRSRPQTTTEITPTQFISGRKRPIHSQVSSVFSELPSKRLQASQKDNEGLFILAEADYQPCQEQ